MLKEFRMCPKAEILTKFVREIVTMGADWPRYIGQDDLFGRTRPRGSAIDVMSNADCDQGLPAAPRRTYRRNRRGTG